MEAGQERAYTDRDVRDNPGYREAVEDYLSDYTGEFGFLIDMKMRAANGVDLTTGMVRGVLNCMRHDPRVKHLPTPTEEDFEDVDNVVPMRGKEERAARERHPAGRRRPSSEAERRVRERQETPVCPLLGQEHGIHWYGYEGADVKPGSQWHCLGWHAITREITRTAARFHGDYLRGTASNVVHRSTHEGEVVWFPDHFHEEGGVHVSSWSVKPVCYTPPIQRAQTLTAEQVKVARPLRTPSATQGGKYPRVTLCRRCFPGTDGEEVGLP
jgi:hypothetical protein